MSTENASAKNLWPTCKNLGKTCPICGHGDRCNMSGDGQMVKCWRDGGTVHHIGTKPAQCTQKPDDYGRHQKPSSPIRTFLTAEAAAAAYPMGAPPILHLYHTADGSRYMGVGRWPKPGGKEIRPVGNIGTGWIQGDPPEPFPLYRLPELLAADPAEPVFVCEGEKATDAAASIGLTATTSAHGSSQALRTDWTPLAGRYVVILPDNDEPGEKYGAEVASILTTLDPPARVRVLDLGLPNESDDIVEYIEALDCKDPEDIKRGILEMAALVEPFKPERPGPKLVCMADVAPRSVSWLWMLRIPAGRLTLIVGSPGLGKSFLTCDLSARVTTGRPWPDGTPCEQGEVLLITAEDDPHDTIRPRLDVHGADVKYVHLLEGVRRRDEKGRLCDAAFTLADVPALEAALQAHPNTRLVIIDPVGSFLGFGVDAHRDNEVRAVLAPVAALAAKYGPAIVLIMHRKKSGGPTADSLALGSTGFVGLARVVWHVCRDPHDRDRRLFLAGKNNLSADKGGLAFRIEGEPIGRVVWEEQPVPLSADEVVAEEQGQKHGPSPDALEDAKELLREVLRNGPVRCGYNKADPKHAEKGTIWAYALEANVSFRTLQRAKRALQVRAYKEQFTGHWVWELSTPAQDAKQGRQAPANEEPMADLAFLAAFEETSGRTP